MKAECISCGEWIDVGKRPKLGQLVTCPSCGARLEIVSLDPIELDWPLEGEDYEEDEGEKYEDEYK